jgi:hypothetical protein
LIIPIPLHGTIGQRVWSSSFHHHQNSQPPVREHFRRVGFKTGQIPDEGAAIGKKQSEESGNPQTLRFSIDTSDFRSNGPEFRFQTVKISE